MLLGTHSPVSSAGERRRQKVGGMSVPPTFTRVFAVQLVSCGRRGDLGLTDRFQKLEEALQIILGMLRGERVTLDGEHYRVEDAFCSPPPLGPVNSARAPGTSSRSTPSRSTGAPS